jgi:hypothetical protein
MNKHELKSLLENIYSTLTEADIPDNPPAPEGYNPLPQEPWPWPPNNPLSPKAPTERPNGMSPFLPPMPLDPNGRPLFPSQKFWAEYYRAMRAIPSGGTLQSHPIEMERFRELTRQLQEWQRRQQQQQRPNDGGTLG